MANIAVLILLAVLSGCIFIWGGTNIRVNDAHTDAIAAAPGSKVEEKSNAIQKRKATPVSPRK
jgi:hypothetical protein